MNVFEKDLERLRATANLRCTATDADDTAGLTDLTSNDYLGIATRRDWMSEFLDTAMHEGISLTSSASRLLTAEGKEYNLLENRLTELYCDRRNDDTAALLFNSGYHANVGIVSAMADSRTLIIADKLVHASIIDGIILSKAKFTRFRHNDFSHLESLIKRNMGDYDRMLVIVESVYSMDGDSSDTDWLIDIKRRYPQVMLYVDEAHAFGVCGPQGLGLAAASAAPAEIDIVVGTLGKAAASSGAFAIVNPVIREYLVNHSRSLIFSTAIAPINVAWSRFVIDRMIYMDDERAHLAELSSELFRIIRETTGKTGVASHIQPLIVGDSARTLRLSKKMRECGVKVLPIRTPTVPPGTERLRFSLSSALDLSDLLKVEACLSRYKELL